MKTDPFDSDRKQRPEEGQEKKSWRERDAMRNKSRHVSEEKVAKPKSYELKRDETAARKALDQLFSGKKTKEQAAAWKKVLEGQGKTFSTRANKYVEDFGLPHEWDDLLRLLDHRDVPFIQSALDKMMGRAAMESPIRRDLLIGKLRVLKIERDEPQLVSRFEECISELSAIE